MKKIFAYELRRMVLNKFFLGLIAVCLFFSWQVLTTATIQGVANTAPFSSWSFGSFLGNLSPILSVSMLFLIWGMFSEKVKKVENLTAATEVKQTKLFMVRLSAAAVALLILAAVVIISGVGFLLALFKAAVPLRAFIFPTLVALLPILFFSFGLGAVLGVVYPPLIIAAMPVVAAAGLYSGRFFNSYPLTLTVLDPEFAVPNSEIIVALVFIALGSLMVISAIKLLSRRKNNIT